MQRHRFITARDSDTKSDFSWKTVTVAAYMQHPTGPSLCEAHNSAVNQSCWQLGQVPPAFTSRAEVNALRTYSFFKFRLYDPTIVSEFLFSQKQGSRCFAMLCGGRG